MKKREPKFIYKKRSVEAAAYNPFRPRGQVCYGRWQTISKHDTFDEAVDAMQLQTAGLYDRGVFYRGERITDHQGVSREEVKCDLCGRWTKRDRRASSTTGILSHGCPGKKEKGLF